MRLQLKCRIICYRDKTENKNLPDGTASSNTLFTSQTKINWADTVLQVAVEFTSRPSRQIQRQCPLARLTLCMQHIVFYMCSVLLISLSISQRTRSIIYKRQKCCDITPTTCNGILPNDSTTGQSAQAAPRLTLCKPMVTAKPHSQHVNGPDSFTGSKKA